MNTNEMDTQVELNNTKYDAGQIFGEFLAYGDLDGDLVKHSRTSKFKKIKSGDIMLLFGNNRKDNAMEDYSSHNNNVDKVNLKLMEVRSHSLKANHCSHESVNNLTSSKHNSLNVVESKITFMKKKDITTEPFNGRNETECAEKATFCRPATNIYDREFINKTKERNDKLQQLVKKLMKAREKEKRNNAWNKYINELKSKHGHIKSQTSQMPILCVADHEIPDIIDDCYNDSKNSWKHSPYCENLLKDVYGATNEILPEESFRPRVSVLPTEMPYKYTNNCICFPTSSQARLTMINKERQLMNQPKITVDKLYKPLMKNKKHNRACESTLQQTVLDFITFKECLERLELGEAETKEVITFYENDKDLNKVEEIKQDVNTLLFKKNFLTDIENKLDELIKLSSTKNSEIIKSNKQIESTFQQTESNFIAHKNSPQTDRNLITNKESLVKSNTDNDENKYIMNPDYEKNSKHFEESEQILESDAKDTCLSIIENKLDSILNSFNIFLNDIRAKKLFKSKRNTPIARCTCKCAIKAKTAKMLTCDASCDVACRMTHENVLCGITHGKSETTVTYTECPSNLKRTIDEIMYEEINKSDKVKSDIDKILSRTDCPIYEVPTKECKEDSTEVTESLFMVSLAMVEEEIIGQTGRGHDLTKARGSADSDDNRTMTIAVNTDPLGILALFRVSAETVRQVLSYVPTVDYSSYLSRLNVAPQDARATNPRYVCKVCGLAFGRPSQLSDHILNHNMANPRNCCVCRHVLDSKRHRAGLSACRYCGHMFTRTYCRELHEQACSQRDSKVQNAAPSLTLLT